MTEMAKSETIERYNESMKRAASRAKELAIAQNFPLWNAIAESLETMRLNGMTLANAKGRSKFQVERDIEDHKARLAIKEESVQ